jgi:hypothetical protein
LVKIFRRVLALAAPVAPLVACTSHFPDAIEPSDAAPEAIDASDDVGVDADVDDGAACAPVLLDAGDPCESTGLVLLPCGTFDAGTNNGLSLACVSICSICPAALSCDVGDPDGGVATLRCDTIGGRRPVSFAREAVFRAPGAGAWFARAFELEAASVVAFRELRDELRAHGAPKRLLDACTRAAKDEARHACATARLARGYGVSVTRSRVAAPNRLRSLRAIAIDNAREGCVRESFGALLARAQASRSTDARVRRALERIARDESRHAALALRINAWIESKLTASTRDSVRRAKCGAWRALARELHTIDDYARDTRIGLPSSREASAMARSLKRALMLSTSV